MLTSTVCTVCMVQEQADELAVALSESLDDIKSVIPDALTELMGNEFSIISSVYPGPGRPAVVWCGGMVVVREGRWRGHAMGPAGTSGRGWWWWDQKGTIVAQATEPEVPAGAPRHLDSSLFLAGVRLLPASGFCGVALGGG